MSEKYNFQLESRLEWEVCESCLEIAGMKLRPDPTKAYIEFFLSHSFPVVTSGGMAIHPQVVANSYQTLLHQQFDFGHEVRAFDKENIARDRMLGSVVAVEFPKAPIGGWKVPASVDNAPGIRGAAVLHKLADGADRIIGAQQTGRRKRTVSMEVFAFTEPSGLLVKSDKPLANGMGSTTPEDILAHGWWYVDYTVAPEDLRQCWGGGGKGIHNTWKGKEVVFLNGGLDGEIHYMGVGLVDIGKEPTARVSQILAGSVAAAGNGELEMRDRDGESGVEAYEHGLLEGLKEFSKINHKTIDGIFEMCSRSGSEGGKAES
jgi:hypothetical protein